MTNKRGRNPNGCPNCGRTDLVPAVDNRGESYMGCPSCRIVFPDTEKMRPMATPLKELDVVRIKAPMRGGGGWTEDPDLPAGAVGTIVHVHEPRFEVEFTDDEGKTLRVATVLLHDLEPVEP